MDEGAIEKLNQEKEAHIKTKNELEIALKEKEELLNRIEKLAKTISILFSKIIMSLYLPLLITILNYYFIEKIHPLRKILIIQGSLSILVALTSIFMGVTGRGLAKKLRRILKIAVYRLFGIKPFFVEIEIC